MLGRRFVYVAVFLCIALAILRLHYGLQYSWTFVGKISADFAVPLAMGWAGVHLAAEVKADRERKLWQAVFALLAVFGLVVSFLVERQLDHDHNKEIGDLRGGIKDDVIAAFLRYNEGHPQHPVTSEQFVALTKSLNGLRDQGPVKSLQEMPHTPQGLPKDEVVDLLHKEAAQIRDEWNAYWNVEDQSLDTRARYLRQQGATSEIDKARLQQLVDARQTIRTMFNIRFAGTVKNAEFLQDEAIRILSTSKTRTTKEDYDKTIILHALATGNLKYDGGHMDLPGYLEGLANRVAASVPCKYKGRTERVPGKHT